MRKLALSDEILLSIQQPARYIGGEGNMVVKDHSKVRTKFAFAFPDVYEWRQNNYVKSHCISLFYVVLYNKMDDIT